ncbi:MAG: hypothetical protein IIC26_04830 [Chloroflexi bacterium]|nr:hypothetical protein [Chloroflexota bacterium]
MATLQLAPLDAKLIYLALQYHLARPGAELDPESKQPLAHGLAEVAQALEPQLDRAVATVELSEYQRQRLLSAIAGTMNELKTYPLLDAVPPERGGGRRTTVPGFDAVLRRLFPEVDDEPDEAPQLAGHFMSLRRRLEDAAAAAAEEEASTAARSPWWRFWQR